MCNVLRLLFSGGIHDHHITHAIISASSCPFTPMIMLSAYLGLYTFNLLYPQSMTYLMPSTVSEVSAMLVDTIHFLVPSSALSKILNVINVEDVEVRLSNMKDHVSY